MKDKIMCPYCKSENFTLIDNGIKNKHKRYEKYSEYKCLKNEKHIFLVVKFENKC